MKARKYTLTCVVGDHDEFPDTKDILVQVNAVTTDTAWDIEINDMEVHTYDKVCHGLAL
jgi:hypothetical protein